MVTPSRPSTRPALLLNALIVLLGLGTLLAAFFPTVFNWGLHAPAFGPGLLKWIIPALICCLAVPRVQSFGLMAVRRSAGAWLRLPGPVRITAATAGLGALGTLFFLFSSAGIPGDAQFLIHNMFQIRSPSDVAHVFLHEPLTCLLHWFVARGIGGEITPPTAAASYRIISVACGIAFVPLLVSVLRRVVPRRTERVLAALFIMGSGSTLLFFGHIENYTIAYLGLLIFILAGLKYQAGEWGLVGPSVAAGALIPLYFGMMCVLPALGWMYAGELRKTRSPASLFLPAGSFLAVSLGLLLATGFTPERFGVMLTGGGKHLIGILEAAEPMRGYTLLSGLHLMDLGNFLLFLSPFTPLLLLVPPFRTRRMDAASRWLALLAASCAAVVIFFQCELGMPRDWDLLAPFMISVMVFALLRFVRSFPAGEGRGRMLFAAAAVLLLHLVPWVRMDHDPPAAIAQNRMVLEQSTWIGGIHKGFENLAMAEKGRGEYDSAAVFYREFLKGDSSHPRILGNLADVYRVLGMTDSERVTTEKAIRHGTTVPAYYFNLGIIYAGAGRYGEAIRAMEGGLRFEPGRADIVNSIGAFMLRSGAGCREAMPWFTDALRIDPSYALACLNAGECAGTLGDSTSMRFYFSRYMKLDPADAVRRGIPSRLGGTSPP